MPDQQDWHQRLLLLRRLWGYGIAGVMIVAVLPYPIRGIWDSTEIVHRVHNTVGSVQYLVLWAVPVLVWAHWRRDRSSWRLALASALAIFVGALWTGDVFGSGGWLPLVTLLVLWPDRVPGQHAVLRDARVSLPALASAVLLWWVVVATTPDFLHFQNVSGSDLHGLRYHYGGMAAALFALAAGATVVALWSASRTTVLLVAVSSVATGSACLAWSEYDSALATRWAGMTIAAGVLIAPLAFWQWPALQISWRAGARSPSSSSHPRRTTHS